VSTPRIGQLDGGSDRGDASAEAQQCQNACREESATNALNESGEPEVAIFSLLAIVVPSSRETTIPGAILLTGFLGCAEAIQTRVSRSGAFLIMLPLLLGLVAWGGIWLRDDRLRNLIPLRAPPVRREITATTPTLFL
jgi:hypothetical protein